MHLTSGWYKQQAVYPELSEPWKETSAVMTQTTSPRQHPGPAHRLHGPGPAAEPDEREPEAGQ